MLRSGTAPGVQPLRLSVVVAVAVAYGFAIGVDIDRWAGDGWWGFNAQAQAVPVVLLLLASSSAWSAGAFRGGIDGWVERAPESRGRVVAAFVRGSLLWPIAVMVAAVLMVCVVTWHSNGRVDHRVALILATHLLMALFAVVLGCVAGRLLPQAIATLTAVAAMAVLVFVSPGSGHTLFEFMGAKWAIMNPTASLSYGMWKMAFLGMTTLVLGLAALAMTRTTLVRGAVLASLPVVVGQMAGPASMFVHAASDPVECMQGRVQVCVYPGYEKSLGEALQRIEGLLARAEREGVEAARFPQTYRQSGGTPWPEHRGELMLGPDAPGHVDFGSNELAYTLADPVWCKAMYAEQPVEAILDDRQLVLDWILFLDGELSLDEWALHHPELTNDSDTAEAVTKALERMRECERN